VYVRFVTYRKDSQSQVAEGIFQAAADLRDSGELSSHDHDYLQELLTWFGRHLRRPARLTRSRRPHRKNKAISWFKPEATEHLARAHEMARLLGDYGRLVRTIKTERAGYVVYEDRFQVVAEPFTSTRA
jgi:hypothetical protein